MTTLAQLLTELGIERPAGEIEYMSADDHGAYHFAGTLANVFGESIARWTVSERQGEDADRASEEWWLVYDPAGDLIGEFRDTGAGYFFYDPLGQEVPDYAARGF